MCNQFRTLFACNVLLTSKMEIETVYNEVIGYS